MKRILLIMAMFLFLGTVYAQERIKIERNIHITESKLLNWEDEAVRNADRAKKNSSCYLAGIDADGDSIRYYYIYDYDSSQYVYKAKVKDEEFEGIRFNISNGLTKSEARYFYKVGINLSNNRLVLFSYIEPKLLNLVPELKDHYYFALVYTFIGDTIFSKKYRTVNDVNNEVAHDKGKPWCIISNNQIIHSRTNQKVFDFTGNSKGDIALLFIMNFFRETLYDEIDILENAIKKGKEEKAKEEKEEKEKVQELEQEKYEKWKKTTKYKKNIPITYTYEIYECKFCYKECKNYIKKEFKEPDFSGFKNEKYYKRFYLEMKQLYFGITFLGLTVSDVDMYNRCDKNGCKENRSGEHAWKLIKSGREIKSFVLELPEKE